MGREGGRRVLAAAVVVGGIYRCSCKGRDRVVVVVVLLRAVPQRRRMASSMVLMMSSMMPALAKAGAANAR